MYWTISSESLLFPGGLFVKSSSLILFELYDIMFRIYYTWHLFGGGPEAQGVYPVPFWTSRIMFQWSWKLVCTNVLISITCSKNLAYEICIFHHDFLTFRYDRTRFCQQKKWSFFTHPCFWKTKVTTLPTTLFPRERADSQLFRTSKIIEIGSLFVKIFGILYWSRQLLYCLL